MDWIEGTNYDQSLHHPFPSSIVHGPCSKHRLPLLSILTIISRMKNAALGLHGIRYLFGRMVDCPMCEMLAARKTKDMYGSVVPGMIEK
jgi:hypothetical protein